MTTPRTTGPVLLDCTLRDGGYHNDWDFSSDLVNDYLAAMAALGTDYVELGFRSFEREGFKGGCAYTSDSFIARLTVPAGLKLGVMLNASEIVQHADGVLGALQLLFGPQAESPLAMVRIACHLHEFEAVLPGCAWLKNMGYVVGINLMQIADRSADEIEAIGRLASGQPPDVLYFADSMGSMDPDQTARVISALKRCWDGPLGIHTHDNMGQALANSVRAIEEGVTWIDGTVTGMGRGAGNVKTEYLAIELAALRGEQPNISALLALIDTWFRPLQARHGWGTNTYYYLAGKYGIHPTFIQEMLTDARYRSEDILAVIAHLRQAGGKKFNAQALEAGRNFYRSAPGGSWQPAQLLEGSEVLVIGSGPGAAAHRQAIESYIRSARPLVIALNTQSAIAEDLIDLRAACHPVRMLADCASHMQLSQPLVTPVSGLPDSVRAALQGKPLHDFGLAVQADTFAFGVSACTLPAALVIGYVLAMAASGKARKVLLAGFDGYSADDPRGAEVDSLFAACQAHPAMPPLVSVTPSRYKLPATSIYSLI